MKVLMILLVASVTGALLSTILTIYVIDLLRYSRSRSKKSPVLYRVNREKTMLKSYLKYGDVLGGCGEYRAIKEMVSHLKKSSQQAKRGRLK